jgi:hypothetical protein
MATPDAAALHCASLVQAVEDRAQISEVAVSPPMTTNAGDLAFRVLEQSVQDHLNQNHRHLWTRLDQCERHLRRRCLRDRLCRQARLNHSSSIAADAAKWLSYLQTDKGKAKVGRWVDEKVAEATRRHSMG